MTTTKNPREASYWEKVQILEETSSTEDIAFIISTEEEDDFRMAILRNPHATAQHVQWASEHQSLAVRAKVLEHPLVSVETILAFLKDAYADVEENRVYGKGISPMKHHYDWLVEKNTDLILKALAVLTKRVKK